MAVSKSNLYDEIDIPIYKLPIEIITKILRTLSLSDILALSCVSKIWRCHFVNQNIIWRNICENMNIREEDYINCFNDVSRNNVGCKGYIEYISEKLFGPYCSWWSIYNRYNMVLKNIRVNDFATVHVPRRPNDQAYCTDDYIIGVNRFRKNAIEATILNGCASPIKKVYLHVFDLFRKLIPERENTIKIVGNKKYLVLEIHSIIFVYKIEDGKFVHKYFKIIQNSTNVEELVPDTHEFHKFLIANSNTFIDIDDEHLAIVHPEERLLIEYDLVNEKMFKEVLFIDVPCHVKCLKCNDSRVMIGLTLKYVVSQYPTIYLARIFHWDRSDIPFTIPVFGQITQFKVTPLHIGVENESSESPFLARISKMFKVFWVDCDTFSIDVTRNFIYYNINSSIFKYDLSKSLGDKFEVTQKIAIDAISNRFSLTPINDRFLIVRSTFPNSYDIFDVKDHISVRSIQLAAGYSLAHVGKLSIIFTNSKEFVVTGFY